ncbi:Short-chain dehydrogenase [Streptomyces graminofaciens]|uniref:Short-chain dehydrogenase n=1 Tax=Streptomyces graminofaciens TaxID=68212 RepID=A0ABM7F6T8_9ACTN|nr:SDR family NAD(P)-dependent oxidoreductase [Streptomyces graminofaciens]BBC31420.1 Short-chain dehydrogenase [Streptomyces graminofaciens]
MSESNGDGTLGAGGITPITEQELAAFHRTVGRLRALPVDDPARLRAEQVAASFVRDGRLRRRKALGVERSAADAAAMAATATGALERREDAPLTALGPPGGAATSGEASVGVFRKPRTCYVCKTPYRQVDSFYHRLCPECAADNTARRALSTDLSGRRALLTGGRVKIGFQLALMMLRDGVELLVTSRFPHDTVRRFRAEPDSEKWLDRLTVVAVDLRDPRQVLGLCEQLRQEGEPLDILVNNAAQTVRRPPEAYALLAAGERDALPEGARQAPGFTPMRMLGSGGVSALPVALREADEAGLLPDPSPENSWSARLGELDPAEVLETQLVNALAPALLCDRLLPLLLAAPRPRRYVVNVTAVEGRFAVRNKTAGHPHTNMAKAALNMLTRTSAAELAGQGVFMCAVDTGWITDENPAPKKERMAGAGFRTPLDIVDGAARVYDPIVRGEAGEPLSGVFLKDYRVAEW